MPMTLSKRKLEPLQQHLVLKCVRRLVILPTHSVIASLVVYASLVLPVLTAPSISVPMRGAVSMASVPLVTLATRQVSLLSIKLASVTKGGTDHFVINKMQ